MTSLQDIIKLIVYYIDDMTKIDSEKIKKLEEKVKSNESKIEALIAVLRKNHEIDDIFTALQRLENPRKHHSMKEVEEKIHD